MWQLNFVEKNPAWKGCLQGKTFHTNFDRIYFLFLGCFSPFKLSCKISSSFFFIQRGYYSKKHLSVISDLMHLFTWLKYYYGYKGLKTRTFELNIYCMHCYSLNNILNRRQVHQISRLCLSHNYNSSRNSM